MLTDEMPGVGHDSIVALRGGPFGRGWIGPIGEAHSRAEHDLSGLGVESRAWVTPGFGWAGVGSINKFAARGRVLSVVANGSRLFSDASTALFHARDQSYLAKRVTDVEVGDVLISDDGRSWTDGTKETPVDVMRETLDLTCRQVEVDLSGTSRAGLGLTPQQWHNFKARGRHGTRLPIEMYDKHKERLGLPSRIYLGRGKAPGLKPIILLSEWSYMFGFFMGDGWVDSSTRIVFAVEDDRVGDFIGKIDALGLGLVPKVTKANGASVEIRYSHRMLAHMIDRLCGAKCYEKEIPAEWITTWPCSARRELVRGLVDSDGHVDFGDGRQASASYATTSHRLAITVQTLLRSLGVSSGMHARAPSLGGMVRGNRIVGKRVSYQVHWSWNSFDGINSGHKGAKRRLDWSSGLFNESPVRSVTPSDDSDAVYSVVTEAGTRFTASGLVPLAS